MKITEPPQSNLLKKLGIAVLLVLSLEYILGMATALFVTFPSDDSAKILWKFAGSQLLLALHMIVGMLLLVFSIAILGVAVKQKTKKWIFFGVVGIVSILAATATGSQFVSTQNAMQSFLMSVFFMISCMAYVAGVAS